MSITIYHYTQREHLDSICSDGILRREGHNIQSIVEQVNKGEIPIHMINHPSGLPISAVWRNLKVQYKLVGRYVWFTEESDVRCITAQQGFQKAMLVAKSDVVGAKRWIDVMRKQSVKSKKAKKNICTLNRTAKCCGDDITKWWVVDRDVPLSKCERISLC